MMLNYPLPMGTDWGGLGLGWSGLLPNIEAFLLFQSVGILKVPLWNKLNWFACKSEASAFNPPLPPVLEYPSHTCKLPTFEHMPEPPVYIRIFHHSSDLFQISQISSRKRKVKGWIQFLSNNFNKPRLKLNNMLSLKTWASYKAKENVLEILSWVPSPQS